MGSLVPKLNGWQAFRLLALVGQGETVSPPMKWLSRTALWERRLSGSLLWLGRKVPKELPVLRVLKATPVQRERLAQPVLQDPLAPLAHRGLKGFRRIRLLWLVATLARRRNGWLLCKGLKARRVCRDRLVLLAPQGLREPLVRKVPKGSKALRVLLVLPELQALLDRLERRLLGA